MRVSRSSWHYRWWNWVNDHPANPPTNLCRYFWGIVLPALTMLGLALLALVGLGYGIYWTFIRYTLATLAVVALGSAAFLVFWGSTKVETWWKNRPTRTRRPPKPAKEPGLVRSYLRAKKQRVCPLIEVVD
jgi:hypothetical protein